MDDVRMFVVKTVWAFLHMTNTDDAAATKGQPPRITCAALEAQPKLDRAACQFVQPNGDDVTVYVTIRRAAKGK